MKAAAGARAIGLGLCILASSALAQSVDDYRSHQSGNWDSTSTWERWNGTTWVTPAPAKPTSANGVITVQTGNIVTVTANNDTVDQVVVTSGGQITIGSGDTLRLANGPGTDLSVSGTIVDSGAIALNAGATISFASGSSYQRARDGGTIPTATWNSGSTCLVTGTVGNLPGGLNQTFAHLTWNCAGQTANTTFNNTLRVNGNLTVQSTGSTGHFRFAPGTNTIGGDFIVSGGFVRIAGASNRTITVTGNVTITGGTIEIADNTGTGLVNVAGNFSQTTGTIQRSGTSTTSGFVFNGSSAQTLTTGGTITSVVDFTVNSGATLQCPAGATLTGGGSFTLSSGATLNVGSVAGIAATAASGNIQVTGARTYSKSANYGYNGASAQSTGDGLPDTVNSLTINNAAGVTVQTARITIAGTLALTSGNLTTGTGLIVVGTGASTLGTLSRTSGTVIGNFKRWFAASTVSGVQFPIGTAANYRPASVSFTSAPSAGGTLLSSFTASDPGSSGLPLVDGAATIVSEGKDGYWTLTAGDGLTGGTYSLDLTADGFSGVSNFATLEILERANGSSPWTLNGTNAAGTGSNATPVVHRTGMSGFGDYGVGGASDNALPIQLSSFSAASLSGTSVKLDWTTQSEVNNYGFQVQRSAAAGAPFVTIPGSFIAGHGTTAIPQHYSFTDAGATPGTWYYRLQQTDLDGTAHFSDPLQVQVGATAAPSASVPAVFGLAQNYPNPFNPETVVAFTVAATGRAQLHLYDILGRDIAKLYDGMAQPGQSYTVNVNGTNLASGIYFYRLESAGKVQVRRMILAK